MQTSGATEAGRWMTLRGKGSEGADPRTQPRWAGRNPGKAVWSGLAPPGSPDMENAGMRAVDCPPGASQK